MWKNRHDGAWDFGNEEFNLFSMICILLKNRNNVSITHDFHLESFFFLI